MRRISWVIILVMMLAGLLAIFACDDDSAKSPITGASPTPADTLVTTPTVTASPIINPSTQTSNGVPLPTRNLKNCVLDREDLKVCLADYYQARNEWPTKDGQPGDIEWNKLVPQFIEGIPYSDDKCDWQINIDPPGEICLANYC